MLDRSTVLLVSSTKCVLRHPDSASARETRDTVFCQMRRAIDLIHFVIREGISADQGADDVDLIDMPGVLYQVGRHHPDDDQQTEQCFYSGHNVPHW